MKCRWHFMILCLSVLLLAFVSGCGQSAAPSSEKAGESTSKTGSAQKDSSASKQSFSPDVQKLIEGAKKEGALNLSWSPNFIDGGKHFPDLERAFNKHFGLNIKIKFTPAPSMPQMVNKVTQEVKAGQSSVTDLFLGSTAHFASLIESDVLQPVEWAKLADYIPKEAISPKNMAVAYSSWFPGIEYNTKRVKPEEAPKLLEDLLDPKWKGRVASTPYAAGFDRLALGLGEDKVKNFLNGFSQHIGGLIRCGEEARVINGEYDVFALDCGVHAVQQEARTGAPLGFVLPKDALRVDYWYLGVPKISNHPNTATLLALWFMSEEGQKFSYENDFLDLHFLPKSQSAKLIQPLLNQGAKLFGEAGVSEVMAHPETEKYRTNFQKILEDGAKKAIK